MIGVAGGIHFRSIPVSACSIRFTSGSVGLADRYHPVSAKGRAALWRPPSTTLMDLRTFSFTISTALLSSVNAQVTVDWIQDGGLSLALDQQNNVFTVFYDANLGGDITLTKRNADGELLWDTSYDQTSTTRFDRATWVATDPQGNALVSGTVMSGFSNPVNANSLLMKFAPDGSFLWRQEYATDFDGSSTRKCLVDLAGATYVLGIGTGPNGQVTTVRKFAPDGSTLWSWFDVGIGAPLNIKFTPDSALVIAHRAVVGNINGYTKLDRDGATIWSIGNVNSFTAGDLAGDANGNTYLVSTGAQSGSNAVLRKVSPAGEEIWQQTYPITAYRVEVGTDQAPVLSGFPLSGSGGAAFLKADPDGIQLWVNNDVDGVNNFLLHAQLMLDASNNAYLCAGVLFNMGICKVYSDGSSAWAITAGTGGSQAFALGTDGNVYVTGGSTLRIGQGLSTAVDVMTEVATVAPLVYPVPARDQLFLSWDGHAIHTWRIRTVTGMLLAEGRYTGSPLDIERFAAGPLVVELVDLAGARAMVRVFKR